MCKLETYNTIIKSNKKIIDNAARLYDKELNKLVKITIFYGEISI